MKLHALPKTTTRKKKRLGRGGGSGKGFHTSTRGQKGQKSRSSVASWFEGGQLPLTKRLPFLRGKDRFKSLSNATIIINLEQLNSFKKGAKVDKQALVKAGLVSEKEAVDNQLKLLGKGELTVALNIVGLAVSKSAQEKIQKAGGTLQDK